MRKQILKIKSKSNINESHLKKKKKTKNKSSFFETHFNIIKEYFALFFHILVLNLFNFKKRTWRCSCW
jgi:hypothetical protein